jgi:multidrug efflux system membrane fusion protein
MHGELPKQAAATTKPRRWRRRLAGLVILLAVAGALYYVFGTHTATQKRPNRFAAEGPVPVLAQAVARANVPVYLDAVGTVKALNTVTVRAQVDGKLLSVNFVEGQDVKKGDVLAKIDPTIYQAQLDQAIAKKAQDEAQLSNAKLDLERYEKLAATNAINKQQADTQRALVAQYQAVVQADQASIENAQATLGYTNIVAPIAGRTGIRNVDEGNIVHASDTTGIVTLAQIQPIAVQFNLPQQDLMRVIDAFGKGSLPVDALRSDTNAVVENGKLTVIDNQVDTTTGTVKLKAEFPNAQIHLWPGEFINVRLLIDTLQNVVVIPTAAVQRGPNGTFVYVVDDQNKARMRPITVQRQDENQAVVKSGVEPPERVVTTGFVRLTDGTTVSIGSATGAPAAPPANGTRKRNTAPGAAGAVGSGEPRKRGNNNGGGGNQRP